MEIVGQKITDSDKNERLIWSGDCRGHEHFPNGNVCRLKSMQSITRIPKWNKNLVCLLSFSKKKFRKSKIFSIHFFFVSNIHSSGRLCHCHTHTHNASWNKERKRNRKKYLYFSRRKLRASFTQRALNREHFVRFALGNDLTVFFFSIGDKGEIVVGVQAKERELFRRWNHSRNPKKKKISVTSFFFFSTTKWFAS
jgi:hypothetical protein